MREPLTLTQKAALIKLDRLGGIGKIRKVTARSLVERGFARDINNSNRIEISPRGRRFAREGQIK